MVVPLLVGHETVVELGAATVLVVEDVLVWLITVVLDATDVLVELTEDAEVLLVALVLTAEALEDALPTSLAPQTPLYTA